MLCISSTPKLCTFHYTRNERHLLPHPSSTMRDSHIILCIGKPNADDGDRCTTVSGSISIIYNPGRGQVTMHGNSLHVNQT